MAGKKDNTLKFRPYARLLTMLGDQLIKNEKVALIELIKNSYDADANWVQIRLSGFTTDPENEDILTATKQAMIEIEDDGEGMSFEVLEDAWMNPATPIKYNKKDSNETRRTDEHKRIIQGEKGIGRFAVYKLASCSKLITRSKHAPREEIEVTSDFSNYDDDFLKEGEKKKEIYLDQLAAVYERRSKPLDLVSRDIVVLGSKIKRREQGTIIRLTHLKGEWTMSMLRGIITDLGKIESPFKITNSKGTFKIDLQINGTSITTAEKLKKKLEAHFVKAPIRITDGSFDNDEQKFIFQLNDRHIEIDLDRLKRTTEYRKRFIIEREDQTLIKEPKCGSFKFRFYIFDLTSEASPKFQLSAVDKEFVKRHRIYLYRDDIRVLPYGDPDDDWLGIDVLRGTGRAGDYLSMDQTIGYVSISQVENVNLKDKTNREGLIEFEGALEDFKALIQTLLGHVKSEYDKYKSTLLPKDVHSGYKKKRIKTDIDQLRKEIKTKKYSDALETVSKIELGYQNERTYLAGRAEQTEDLAAVGLAVETASHDIMLMITRAKETLTLIIEGIESGKPDMETVENQLYRLLEQVVFVEEQLEGIQPMFSSTRRKSEKHDIKGIVEKVQSYFNTFFENNDIELIIKEEGSPMSVNCNEGVLLQTFINLFDNSVYWLNTVDVDRKITVVIDSAKKAVTVADNGPGVDENDLEYIFNPFFSTKGLQGRGLGLYIVNQILGRFDYSASYLTDANAKILEGANFKINFNPKS